MKLIFSSLIPLLICSQAMAVSIRAKVLEYNSKNYLLEKEVELHHLYKPDRFDGKYFKIVDGKSDEAILTSSSNAMRAAQLYYHLSKARDYFIQLPNANRQHLDKQTTIRLDLTNLFDPYAHFAHDDFKKDYNTAITIPASDDERLEDVAPWGAEIWFRPMKIIATDAAARRIADQLGTRETKLELMSTILNYNLDRVLSNGFTSTTWTNLTNDSNLIVIGAGVLAIELLPAVLRFSSKISKTTFYIDTAMVPEIIYHEYAHLALSDYMDLESTPVIEGFANYFAGQIAGKAYWGHGPGKYSRDQGRNAYAKDLYSFMAESKLFSTSSFVYKVLWGLKKIITEKSTTQLIYNCRKGLNRNSDIKHHMINQIFENLKSINKDDALHRMKLHHHLQQMGL